MTCEELRVRLDAYLDRELDVARSLDAKEHLADCIDCQWAHAREREFRALLKNRLPRVAAPPELRARIRASLAAADRRLAWPRVSRALRWVSLPAGALALLALAFGLRALTAPALPPVVGELISQHQVYSRVQTPAEVVSADQTTVAGWLHQRVRFEVPVPDFSPAGIRLVGARLSSFSDREVAYILYEKQDARVSLFAFSRRGVSLPDAGWIEVGDSRFYVTKSKGLEVVLWAQGDLAYGLVSPLNREALLECALTVWRLSPRPPGLAPDHAPAYTGLMRIRLVLILSLLSAVLAPALAADDPFKALELIKPSRVRTAPNFAVPSPGGKSIRLADYREKVVFLNFWATWCLPCREEMPSMEKLYQRYKDKGLVVLAISVDTEGAKVVTPFVKELKLTYPIGLDPEMTLAQKYGVRALPSSFLVDKKGRLVALALGPRDWDSKDAHALIELLLKQQ